MGQDIGKSKKGAEDIRALKMQGNCRVSVTDKIGNNRSVSTTKVVFGENFLVYFKDL